MPRDYAHEPFLKAIVENVEDDAPRLVYADWLEERGDPRAEFIRVQCQLDKLANTDPARPPLLEREQQMMCDYSKDWLRELPPLDDKLDWTGFHRGFPLAAIDFVKIDNTLGDREALEYFESLTWRFNQFVNQGNPACLKLDSGDYFDSSCSLSFLARALSSPYLLHVIDIKAYGILLSNHVVKVLATSSQFRTYLRRLDLTCRNGANDPELNDEAVEALAGSPRMAYLRELILDCGWEITDRGAAALARSSYLRQLSHLRVAAYSHLMTVEGEAVLKARFSDCVEINWLG